jgi:hypothetical protein
MVKYFGENWSVEFGVPNAELAAWEKATGVRVFTQDMWHGFAGCQLFGKWDGTLSPERREEYRRAWKDARNHPVYREIGEWLVIIDGQMVGCYGQPGDDGDFTCWMLDLAFPSQKAAAAYLAMLPAEIDPVGCGFTKI